MKFFVVLTVILAGFLQYNDGYVWEGKKLVIPVYHRRPATVLYSSMGVGSSFDSHQDRFRRGALRNHIRPTEKGSQPIPPSFVRSAQLHLKTPELNARILSKPKRWAISTVYEPSPSQTSSNVEYNKQIEPQVLQNTSPKPEHQPHMKPSVSVLTESEPSNRAYDSSINGNKQEVSQTEQSPTEKESNLPPNGSPMTDSAAYMKYYEPQEPTHAEYYEPRMADVESHVRSYEQPMQDFGQQSRSYEPAMIDFESRTNSYESSMQHYEPESRPYEPSRTDMGYQTRPYEPPMTEVGSHARPYEPPMTDLGYQTRPYEPPMDAKNQKFVGETGRANKDNYRDGTSENTMTESRQGFQSFSEPQENAPNRSSQGMPSWIEGYRLQEEDEAVAPMNAVRRSPSPWAMRDVYRLGQPRHELCMQAVDRGVGPDEISAWYYEPNEYRCRWFGYRGYGGNANRFYSRTACEAYCIRDLENLCEAVTCKWPGTNCVMMGDDVCKENERRYGRDWRLKCPPNHAVCVSRRNTRMAPDINFQPIPPECFQSKDDGSCERRNPAVNFYYDRERNTCMTFYYHRCGGNDNRFETKSDCMTQCSP